MQVEAGWPLVTIGLLFIGLGVFQLTEVRKLMRFGLKSIGEIVSIVEQEASEGINLHPIIEYKIYTGEILQAKTKIGWINPKLNQKVVVFYYKNQPEEILENVFFSKYGASLIQIGSGLISCFIGITLNILKMTKTVMKKGDLWIGD